MQLYTLNLYYKVIFFPNFFPIIMGNNVHFKNQIYTSWNSLAKGVVDLYLIVSEGSAGH